MAKQQRLIDSIYQSWKSEQWEFSGNDKEQDDAGGVKASALTKNVMFADVSTMRQARLGDNAARPAKVRK